MLPGLEPSLAAFVVGFAVGVPLLWAPLLVAASVRRLFAAPTDALPLNYALGAGGFALAHALAVLAALLVVAGRDGANLLVVFRTAVGVTVGLLAVAWLVLVVGVPRLGWWSPTGEGADGRLVLAAGGVWYLGCTTAVFGLLALVMFVVSFPG